MSTTKLFSTTAELAVDRKAVDAAAAALDKAITEAGKAAATLQAEEANVRDLRAAVVAGRDVSAEDLRSAESRAEHSQLRVQGADRVLREVRAQRSVTDLELITTLHTALAEVLPGVETYVGLGAPATAPKGSLPHLQLTQETGHKPSVGQGGGLHTEGGVAGRAILTYTRSEDLHMPLTQDRVQDALEAAGIEAAVHITSSPGQDVATIEVVCAIPEVPQVPYPARAVGPTTTRDGVAWLASIVSAATSTPSGHFLYGSRPDPDRISGPRRNGVHLQDAPRVNSRVEAVNVVNGRRLTVLQTTATVVSRHGEISGIESALRASKEVPVGKAISLGRVIRSELATTERASDDGKARVLEVISTLTIASKV